MKRKIKRTFKLLLGGFVFLALLGLGGLWRLAVSPLRITKDSKIMRYIPNSLQFDELYLGVGQLYTIPELELTNVNLHQDGFHIKAPKLYATWKISHLLQGDIKVSSVRILRPYVSIQINSGHHKSPANIESTARKISEDIISKLIGTFSKVPVKYLELKNATLVIHNHKKTYTFSRINFYALQLGGYINAQLQGYFIGPGTNPFFLVKAKIDRKTLDLSGKIELRNLIGAELPVEGHLKSKLSFFKCPLSLELVYNFYPATQDFYVNGKTFLRQDKKQIFHLSFKAEKTKGQHLSIDLAAPMIRKQDINSVWYPHENQIRPWVQKSLLDGGVRNFNLRLLFDREKDAWHFSDVKGHMELDQMTLRYKSDLLPVSHINGRLYFDKTSLWATAHRALYRDLQFSKIQIKLSGLNEDHIHLDGGMHFRGPFKDAIAYLNQGFLKKHLPKKLHVRSGAVKGTFHLSTPLSTKITSQKTIFDTNMTLQNGSASFLHNGHALGLRNTNLAFNKSHDEMSIEGNGNVDGFKATFKIEENYQKNAKIQSRKKIKGAGRIKGLMEMLPPSVATLIKTTENGLVSVDFLSESQDEGSEKIKVDIDAQKTDLSIPLLNWHKKKNTSARFQMDLETEKGLIKTFKSLSFLSANLHIVGKAEFQDNGKISGISLSPFLIGDKRGRAHADLRDGIWGIHVDVPYLNLNPIVLSIRHLSNNTSSKSTESKFSCNLDLHADTLFLKPEYMYKNFHAQVKFRDNDVHWVHVRGKDGEDDLSIRYQPHGENMVLEVDIPRLETLLNGLDITKNIRGKSLQIQAQKPLKNMDQPIKGKLFLDRLHILQAPIFAKLLSLISIDGLLTGLAEEGLVFNDNYAKFEYKNQNIALRRAYVMNSSIGITAKGYIHLDRKTLDIEGVLVPANFINQLLGSIPIIGQILSGGKDQGIFSVSYGAKGNLKSPDISSNPLGVVAPNLLKGLFSKHQAKPSLTKDGRDATKMS